MRLAITGPPYLVRCLTITQRRYADRLPDERRAERRARLLAAAVDAIADSGYAALAIERLCSAAKVSNRSFYEEFAGKEDLLGALHDDLNAAALVAVVEALDGLAEDDVEARARAGLAAYFATMTADARLAKVVLVEAVGVSPSMEARRQVAADRFAGLLTAELTRLGLPAHGDPTVLAIAVVGAVKELVTAWALGPLAAHPPEHLAQAAADHLLAAARA